MKSEKLKGKTTSILIMALVIGMTVALYFFQRQLSALGNLSYLGAFLIVMASSATIILPMPGFLLVLPLAAAFNPVFIGLASAAGAAVGESTGYMLGYSGRWVIQNRKLYEQSARWLKKWGAFTIFFFAATPLPFDVMGMTAGLLRYPFWKFFLACLSGKIPKYLIIALTGAIGWRYFSRELSQVAIPLLATIATCGLLILGLFIEDRTWKRGK